MAVDFTTVDFSTLGDTFKKVTQHMKVSGTPSRTAAWLREAGGREGGREGRGISLRAPVAALPC